jgi:putative ubiquitin-RnfH superfamily antitoxin RatB of RatAB toxin-antitoxin module
MRVEVVYALPHGQERLLLEMRARSTVQDAIRASGLLARHPEMAVGRIGVWGRAVTPQTLLRDRDRVEIYRPLMADPKEIRRKRAAESGT